MINRADSDTRVARSFARLAARRRPVVCAVALGGAGVLSGWFALLSQHVITGSADTATVILEGQSIAQGNWALKGWSLSLDSFWTIDAWAYAAAIRVVGLGPSLLHVVPAVLASLMVAGACVVAGVGLTPRRALLARLVALALLALPSPVLSFYLLNGPWHIGTTGLCLLAFWSLAPARFGRRWALGVSALTLGLLGDFLMLAWAVLPVAVTGLLVMLRSRGRAGLALVVAAPAALLSALALRAAATWSGTFALTNRNLPIRGAQVLTNLSHLPGRVANLFGIGDLRLAGAPGQNGSEALELVHGIGLACALAGVTYALVRTATAVVGGRRQLTAGDAWSNLEALLAIAVLVDALVYVVTVPDNDNNYVKYLTAGVVFAAVLAARLVARIPSWLLRRNTRALAGLVLIGALGAFLADSVEAVATARAVRPTAALGQFLRAHHLTSGLGDYWSSSLVSVETHGAVKVRPVDTDLSGKIVRFPRLSSASWYRGHTFGFLVYDTARPWHHVNATSATATFGAPGNTYALGTYRVLVWDHPLRVSAAIPSAGSPLQIFWR